MLAANVLYSYIIRSSFQNYVHKYFLKMFMTFQLQVKIYGKFKWLLIVWCARNDLKRIDKRLFAIEKLWNQYLFYKLRLATTNPRLGIRKMREKSKWIWCQKTESQNWFHCMAFKSFWQSLARIVYIDF